MNTYERLVRERHSVRAFLPDPIALATVQQIMTTARRAPSGANLQPGHFWYLQGEKRAHLSHALCAAFRAGVHEQEEYDYFPQPMPMHLRKRQVSAAQALYGALGVARGDTQARTAQFERNYRFFDAPVALVVTIQRDLGHGGFMDLGMCLHSVMLAAQAQGLASCAIGALASYPKLVKECLGLADDQIVVCGLAMGKEDTQHPINQTRTQRVEMADYFSVL